MRRISSQWTFFYKRVFPVIWFGGIIVISCVALFAGSNAGLPFLIFPVVMIVIGYLLMKKLVFDLVDEVWDDGSSLVVKNRGQEQRIALGAIKNVNYLSLTNPPRVTLSLRQQTAFGDHVSFCAPLRLMPFATSPLIEELINRIDAARQKNP